MASYAMNPSRKVTELLGRFLEFDPHQLQVGIWSGELQLSNVTIKAAVLEQLINDRLRQAAAKQQATSSPGNGLSPPWQIELVSGTVGRFHMHIPWKRLVWGPGDVHVELSNVTIVVTIKHHDHGTNNWDDPTVEASRDAVDREGVAQDEVSKEKQQQLRERKQKRLREAERRRLEGQPLAPWLNQLAQKDAQERAQQEEAATVSKQTRLVTSTGPLERFLTEATTGFFWRFYAGLRAQLDNIRIVIVQDNVEMGLNLASAQIIAGKDITITTAPPTSAPPSAEGASAMEEAAEETSSNHTKSAPQQPPEILDYQGAFDDGEHVDKHIKFVGFGLHVRRVPAQRRTVADVNAADYVVRPFDVNYSLSLFWPYPPEKRKKNTKKRESSQVTESASAMVEVNSVHTSNSSKRRRAKRDKMNDPDSMSSPRMDLDHGTGSTEQESGPPLESTPHAAKTHRRKQGGSHELAAVRMSSLPRPRAIRRASTLASQTGAGQAATSMGMPSTPEASQTTPLRVRRQSIMAPLPMSTATAPAGTRASAPDTLSHDRGGRSASVVPLAHADQFAVDGAKSMTVDIDRARLDTQIKVGNVNIVCSVRQFRLLRDATSTCVRVHNGRPKNSIRSVLDQGRSMRRSLTVSAPRGARQNVGSDLAGGTMQEAEREDMRLVLHGAISERSKTLAEWWQYAFGVALREVRRRRSLRREFQSRYLSFSWVNQSLYREEYVSLFIASKLSHATIDVALSRLRDSEQRLLAIEDFLPLEQILLYRALARAAHVRGWSQLPSNLEELRAPDGRYQQEGKVLSEHAQGVPSTPLSKQPRILDEMQTTFHIVKQRVNAPHTDALVSIRRSFQISALRQKLRTLVDEPSFAVSALRSTKTYETSLMRQPSTEGGSEGLLALSFHVTCEQIAFSAVEGDRSEGLYERWSRSMHESPETDSFDEMSEVSGLTDDQRQWETRSGESSDQLVNNDESADDPIVASTDILLFTLPKDAIFRVAVTGSAVSFKSHFGKRRKLGATIAQIGVTGGNGESFVQIGPHDSHLASSDVERAAGSELSWQAPVEAFALKVNNLDGGCPVIQGDVGHSVFTLDLRFWAKALKYCACAQSVPRRLLPSTGEEVMRNYILNQQRIPLLAAIPVSFRQHGIDIILPLSSDEFECSSLFVGDDDDGAVNTIVGEPRLVCSASLIEFYSGKCVDGVLLDTGIEWHQSLSNSNNSLARNQLSSLHEDSAVDSRNVRRLKMLDVRNALDKSSSPLSKSWIVAASHCDFVFDANTSPIGGTQYKLFDVPVQMETLGTVNENSLIDVDRARREITVEISAVDIVLSPQIVQLLSSLQGTLQKGLTFFEGDASGAKKPVFPRIEVLAQYLMMAVDVNIAEVRVLLVDGSKVSTSVSPISKVEEFNQILSSFLSVAATFDLRFPNEEALSSAMQLAIDRLTAMGLQVEDSWEATNSALLAFLEIVAEFDVEHLSDDSELLHQHGNPPLDVNHSKEKVVQESILLACQRLCTVYKNHFRNINGIARLNCIGILDFPDGVVISVLRLFYDVFYAASFGTIFVTNIDGMHLLRIIDTVAYDSDDKRSADRSDDLRAADAGLALRLFQVDTGRDFGRGGLPLSSLVTAEAQKNGKSAICRQEYVLDVDAGEVEVLYASDTLEPVIRSVINLNLQKLKRKDTKSDYLNPPAIMQALASVMTLSLMAATDDLIPLCRMTSADVAIRFGLGQPSATDFTVSGTSFALHDLTAAGELHPLPIVVFADEGSLAFYFENGAGVRKLCFYRPTVSFLRRFLHEMLQFCRSAEYGITRLWKTFQDSKAGGNGDVRVESDNKPHTTDFTVKVIDAVLICPRSSSSLDCVAFVMPVGMAFVTKVPATFELPTGSTSLRWAAPLSASFDAANNAVFHDCIDPLYASRTGDVPRVQLVLEECQIYVGLLPTLSRSESLAIKRLYSRGEIVDNKPFFIKRLDASLSEAEINNDVESCVASAKWHQISAVPWSVLVIADHAPHLRLLVTTFLSEVRSDCSLSVSNAQFCLVLSVWYSNMQELPTTLRFSARQLAVGSRLSQKKEPLPEIGTLECVRMLQTDGHLSSEIAIVLDKLCIRFTDDTESTSQALTPGRNLLFTDVAVHVKNDTRGITRVGCGSGSLNFRDESKFYDDVLCCGDETIKSTLQAWADLSFGLDCSFGSFIRTLPQPFQLSIITTPTWSLYNLGLNRPRLTMTDFSSIFDLLKDFTAYFTDARRGNPIFEASRRLREFVENGRPTQSAESKMKHDEGSVIDFRLHSFSPTLCVPCKDANGGKPAVQIFTDAGFWYHYGGYGQVTSHEICGSGVRLSYGANLALGSTGIYLDDEESLVKGLSFGIRIDTIAETGHSDISVQLPFDETHTFSLRSRRVQVLRQTLDSTTICVPYREPHRYLGPHVCECTCVFELLPVVSAAVVGLFVTETVENAATTGDDTSDETSFVTPTTSFTGSISDVRCFVLDPVLGQHLPVAVLSIAAISFAVSTFGSTTESQELQLSGQSHLWAEYFKLGLSRSWEPLIEPFHLSILHEKTNRRGSGLLVASDSRLHANISGALLVVLDEALDSLSGSFQKAFFGTRTDSVTQVGRGESIERVARIEDEVDTYVVGHEFPRNLSNGERVAFSVRNSTGQEFRYCRHHRSTGDVDAAICYLHNNLSAELTFPPSISVIRNMCAVEVGFPGTEDSPSIELTMGNEHAIDIQIPGFRWLQRVRVDTFGRSFQRIQAQSSVVQKKAKSDWRLSNSLKLLVEVGLNNGGRQTSIRSIFTVINRTRQNLIMRLDPNPSSLSKSSRASDDECLLPNQNVHIPILLLETALRQPGSHLGSIWIRPQSETSSVSEAPLDELDVPEFCSRPIQLAKIVSETAHIFESARGIDVDIGEARSGMQLSCPVAGTNGGQRIPHCFALEIGRSPIIAAKSSEKFGALLGVKSRELVHGPVSYTLNVHAPLTIINLLPINGRFELAHALRKSVLWFADLEPGEEVPIHSVGLDAPLLLHVDFGFCRTPIGDGALVHHGTDPPAGMRDAMLGFKTIGKAGKTVTRQLGRTLVSLGDSPDRRFIERMDRAQSPQNRIRMQRANTGFALARKGHELGLNNEPTFIEGTDGKTYKIDSDIYFPHDVVDETVVIDSVGQRLRLNIENVRGGGGQRRVTVFCPFWIVNTTEHALRYRQENNKRYVSGTVLSKKADGSALLSGGRKVDPRGVASGGDAARQNCELLRCFSGKPGALAGCGDDARGGVVNVDTDIILDLLDQYMPLSKLASLAFMFNFHEGAQAVGHHRLCFQLRDGTTDSSYVSDWSRGIGLDSVGFSHVVALNCKDGRALEIAVLVSVAPGSLAGYTKIIRLLPRYVIVNKMSCPLRLWQDNSVFRPLSSDNNLNSTSPSRDKMWRFGNEKELQTSANEGKVIQYETLWGRTTSIYDAVQGVMPPGTSAPASALYITSARPQKAVPFVLPDSRSDRLLRVCLGVPWALCSSFSADIPGEHAFRVSRAVDLRLLRHASTRTAPQFDVKFSDSNASQFDGELGIWFETEWGNSRSLIVKAVKKNSYAFNETDVHVGDELIFIDGSPVARMTFAESMNILKKRLRDSLDRGYNMESKRLSSSRRASRRLFGDFNRSSRLELTGLDAEPLVLTFRTVEERLRRVRLKAARRGLVAHDDRFEGHGHPSAAALNNEKDLLSVLPFKFVRAELKTAHNTMYIIVKEAQSAPYEVHNRTLNSVVYFRQKGCYAHPWHHVNPGQSHSYAWEEPMKLHRLTVRAALQSAFYIGGDAKRGAGGTRFSASRAVRDEEGEAFSSSTNIRLEEIGFRDFLAVEGFDNNERHHLGFDVDVVGSTRVLVVSDLSMANVAGNTDQLYHHLDGLKERFLSEEERKYKLIDWRPILTDALKHKKHESVDSILSNARSLIDDYPAESTIKFCHQLSVEVLEARGLTPESVVGSCNPYVEIYLTDGRVSRPAAIFGKAELQKTYFVTKSLNPTWHSQVFVFHVPPEAASLSRGHALRIKVKHFRRLGLHSVLGRAQVDLHSLKDEEPLEGWFPLAGRTSRRELENPLSQWGRGSIRLRLQWVFSESALLQYFTFLSEQRCIDLQESIEGMAEQIKLKKEAEHKREAEVDGFRAVRVRDLLSLSRDKANRFNMSTVSANIGPDVFVNKVVEPIRSSTRAALGPVTQARSSSVAYRRQNRNDLKTIGRRLNRRDSRTSSNGLTRYRSKPLSPSFHEIENKISKQRHAFQKLISARAFAHTQSTLLAPITVISSNLSTNDLNSWTILTALANDNTLLGVLDRDRIRIEMAPERFYIPFPDIFNVKSAISAKLRPSRISPSLVIKDTAEYAEAFVDWQASFERKAQTALQTALHPGGWLTIRPFTALNLPDDFVSMSVRLKYGPDSLSSDAVDASVYPTWSKTDDAEASTSSPAKPSDVDETKKNDLHIYVAPQKTSGAVRLAVVGERNQSRMNVRTELGVVFLDVGAAIATCLDHSDSLRQGNSSAYYKRWFPLSDPKSTVPKEGDYGISYRSTEKEQESPDSFNEHFTPCIQLALVWRPETEASVGSLHHEDQFGEVKYGLTMQVPIVENYCFVDLMGISIAVIDSQRALELLALSVINVDGRHWTTKSKTRLGMSVGWIQVDYQSSIAREPVVLAPTPNDFASTVLHLLAVKDNIRSKSDVLSFQFIDFSIAEFDLTLEETLIFDLWDYIKSLRLKRGTANRFAGSVDEGGTYKERRNFPDQVERETDTATLSNLLFDGASDEDGNAKVYVEQLFLGAIRINLSYLKGKHQQWELTRDGAWIEKGLEGVKDVPQIARATGERILKGFEFHHEKSNVFMGWSQHTSDDDRRRADEFDNGIQSIPALLAALLPNVSDAPIRLQGKALNHVFESPGEIFYSIRKFYVTETLRQLYKIIGSLDFVGNPIMLLSSVMSGVRDLVVTPSKAFIRSPTDPSMVGIGMAKGTISLFSHSTSGFFAFLSKVAAAGGQGIATLTLDSDYRTWHRNGVVAEAANLNRVWKRRGLQSMEAMITRPIGDIFLGIGAGVAGVFSTPMKDYRQSGSIGILTGLVKGSIGLVAKPTVGVFDAFSHFTASIHDVARSVNLLQKRYQPARRQRLPYVFGPLNILTPFVTAESRASALMRQYPMGRTKRADVSEEEIPVYVEVLQHVGVQTLVVLSSHRVIVLRVRLDVSSEISSEKCWEGKHSSNVSAVRSRLSEHGHNGCALTFTLEKYKSPVSPNTITPASREKPLTQEGVVNVGDNLSPLSVDDGDATYSSGTGALNHNFHRSTAGDSTEWFKIVAEYQNRPQLARVHNALCCIVGDFDAIVRERSVGNQGRMDGYGITTFGIYHFVPTSSSTAIIRDRGASMLARLEHLTWANSSMYEKIGAESSASQRAYMRRYRDHSSMEDALNASRQLGGPEWLIEARVQATFVVHEVDSPEHSVEEEVQQRPKKKATAANVFSFRRRRRDASKGKNSEQSNELDRGEDRARKNWVRLARPPFQSARSTLQSDDELNEEQEEVENMDETQSDTGPQTPFTPLISSEASYGSFLSADEEFSPRKSSPGLVRSLSDGILQAPRESIFRVPFGARCDSTGHAMPAPSSPDGVQESQQTLAAVEGGWIDGAEVAAVDHSAPPVDISAPPPPSPPTPPQQQNDDTRLARLEAMMERLLLLQTRPAPDVAALRSFDSNDNSTTALTSAANNSTLQQEVDDLRSLLAHFARHEGNVYNELGALRLELAELRAQVGRGRGGGGDYRSGHGGGAEVGTAAAANVENANNADTQDKGTRRLPFADSNDDESVDVLNRET